jgi:Tfp pilus assembly protein PilN
MSQDAMLAINVLPQDMRRVTHTPVARRAAIFAGVALVVGGAAFLVTHYLSVVCTLATNRDSLAEVAKGKQREVELLGYDELMQSIKTFEARKNVVASIWQARLKWAPKLDELIDVVPKYIGLQSLELVKPPAGRKPTKGDKLWGDKLVMKCISDGTELERYEEFVRILRGAPSDDPVLSEAGKKFFRDMKGIVDLGARPTNDTNEPPGLGFSLELYLKDRNKKPAPKAPTPGVR